MKSYIIADNNSQSLIYLLDDVPAIVREYNRIGELPDVYFISENADFGNRIHNWIQRYRMILMRELMKQESSDMPDIIGSIHIKVGTICGNKNFNFTGKEATDIEIGQYLKYDAYMKSIAAKEPDNFNPYVWLGSILKENVEEVIHCFESQFKITLSTFKFVTDKLLYITNHLSSIDEERANEFIRSVDKYIIPPKVQYSETPHDCIFEETLAKSLGNKINLEYHYVFGGATQAMVDQYRAIFTLDELMCDKSSLSKVDQLCRCGYAIPWWVDRKDQYTQAVALNVGALNVVIDCFKEWLPLLDEIENQRCGYDLIEFTTEQLRGYSKDRPNELSQTECDMLINLVTALKKCVLTPNEIQRIWKLDGFNRKNEKVKKFRLWFFQY